MTANFVPDELWEGTEHDEREIAALFAARAGGEPEGPIVIAVTTSWLD